MFKVLFLCRGVGVIDRGAERSTLDLAGALSSHCEVGIVAWGAENLRYRVQRGFKFDFLNKLPNLVNDILTQVRLDATSLEVILFTVRAMNVIRRERPGVVISTGGPWEIWIMKALRFSLKFKIISIGHGGLAVEKQQIEALPDVHVTLSEFSKRSLIRLGSLIPIIKVPNILNVGFSESDNSPRTVNLDEDYVPLVLIVAAGVSYKNVKLTIDAVYESGYRLMWCGDGPLRVGLVDYAYRLFPDGFFQWKTVPMEQMHEVYLEADLFTLVSEPNVEAFGNVYLEAMSLGLRCVATEDETRRELCGDFGFYTNPHDSKAYVTELRRAWEECRTNGRIKWSGEKFSPDFIAQKYLNIFENI